MKSTTQSNEPIEPNAKRPETLFAAVPVELRDYFAGQAIVGLFAGMKTTAGKTDEQIAIDLARTAYLTADAMLAARQQ